MSDQNQSAASVNHSSSSPIAEANAVSTNPTTAAGAASSNGGATMSTTISTMDQLRKKAPQVYKQMLMGIATTITNDMQHQQERLKQAMRDSYHY